VAERRIVAQVAVALPLDRSLDFEVPGKLADAIAVGCRVSVAVQGRSVFGIVIALASQTTHPGPLEPVLSVDDGPRFSPEALRFALHVAQEDLSPTGLFVNRLLPRRTRTAPGPSKVITPAVAVVDAFGALETLARRAPRQAELLRLILGLPEPCTEPQLRRRLGRSIRDPLRRLIEKGLVRETAANPETATPPPRAGGEPKEAEAVLLFAQTRWDRYVEAVRGALLAGRTALVLAPEILAAEELHARIDAAVPGGATLYHSGLPEAERGWVWEATRAGAVRVIVGTRSALFLPIPGEVCAIVDEEQDRSYKQDEMLPHYNARNVALERYPDILMGSAAPSIETFHVARNGGIRLEQPDEQREEPPVRIIDLAAEPGPLSETLVAAIERTLAADRRALLGVNRRGRFRATICKRCGNPLSCPRCGLNLTYDVRSAQLVCPTCGYAERQLVCPHCGSRALRFVGSGGDRLTGEIEARFPGVRVARIDASRLRTVSGAREVAALVRTAPVLVATSILAKGPPLPGLGLVAAIDTDTLLARPDFRAAERTYQFLRGLIGRLGPDGQAIIQTHHPDHAAIRAAADADYKRFYAMEIAEREALSYPPFSHLARLSARREDIERVLGVLKSMPIDVLGPTAQQGTSRMLLKAPSKEALREAVRAAQAAVRRLEIDFDPERL
jgi:primosomal protein N' (replication factor Y) (superfamily II helicase)